MMNRRRVVCLLVPGILAGLCACGGGAKPLSQREYERQLHAIEQQTLAEANPAVFAAQAQGDDRTAAVKAARAAIERQAHSLDRLRPPVEIAKAHAALVAAMYDYADDLGALVHAIENGKLTLRAFQRKLPHLASVRRLLAAEQTIRKRGYGFR
jgi:hypothetical protein